MVSDVAAVAFLVSVCRSVALIFFSFLCFRCEHFAWISEFGSTNWIFSMLRRRGFPLCETPATLLLAPDSMCRLRFFRRWAFGPFDERRKQINWDRQKGRGVMLARNFLHRL